MGKLCVCSYNESCYTKQLKVPEDIVDESARDSAGETAADGGTATQTDVGKYME